jgi:signal transduction histidine kinase
VAVEALVTDAFKTLDGYTLVLSGQKRTIQAYGLGDQDLPAAGTRVRVTGICHVELAPSPEFLRQAGAIHLQARSPSDVLTLEAPRWWTTRKLIVVLSLLAGAILVAGIWNVVLHRQVRRKTAALRQRIESEAALEERQRIAQEFHDTLEQDLTGLGLRLDAAATRTFDESGRHILAVSRSLLTRIQSETKNIVSNLRDPAPLETDLVTAMEEIVKNSAGMAGVEVKLEIVIRPPLLSGSTLHHLHMMARESVNNALKHANASRITISVTVQLERLMVRISDNGRGLENEAVTRGKSGRFGCVGIRERARKIGAVVGWHSKRGEGTTVGILLPLPVSGAHALESQSDPRNPGIPGVSPGAGPTEVVV